MRRRWYVGDGCLEVLFGVWLFGWIPIEMALGTLTTETTLDIFLAAWVGVVLVPAIAAGLVVLISFAWKERPRRVTEPVTEDLREQT